MSAKRVLVAGLMHETHTFVPGMTPLSEWRVVEGEALWQALGDASPMAGTLETAKERGWEVVPIIDMTCNPSAMIEDEVVERFWQAFEATARQEDPAALGGVFLNLHGAMVSQSFLDVEGEVLRRIRALPGFQSVPIGGVLDLHGNITAEMARHSNALVVYRENPHADAKEMAVVGANLLDRLMERGERPVTVWEQPPIVWSPTGTGTADLPMLALEAKAREIEATHPEILAVSVFAGFSFADTPATGVSFMAATLGDPNVARTYLQELSALAMELKAQGVRPGLPLEDALARALQHEKGPVLLVEPADNVGGGSPGDCTAILQALVAQNVPNSAVCLNSPQAVQTLWNYPIGAKVSVAVGGESGVIGAVPVPLEVEIISRSDGRFLLEDRQSHMAVLTGAKVDMGRCVVVKHGGVRILLTSHKTCPFDLGQWRSQGVAPEELFLIGVKAAIGHRRAYDPIAKASYTVDTPGPCAENLQRLPYRNIRRPIYPLDEL